jgi:hypothetical protein
MTFLPLSLGARISKACLHPLNDQAALQFGHGTQDGENHLAGWFCLEASGSDDPT